MFPLARLTLLMLCVIGYTQHSARGDDLKEVLNDIHTSISRYCPVARRNSGMSLWSALLSSESKAERIASLSFGSFSSEIALLLFTVHDSGRFGNGCKAAQFALAQEDYRLVAVRFIRCHDVEKERSVISFAESGEDQRIGSVHEYAHWSREVHGVLTDVRKMVRACRVYAADME